MMTDNLDQVNGYQFTIIYALRLTDLMIHSMHLRQNRDVLCTALPIRLSGVVLATFNLRRIDSSMKRIDSINDTVKEPRAMDPRLYLASRFIEEKTGRNGISGCNNQKQ